MEISNNIRLRALEESDYKYALEWYNDIDIQWYVNGRKTGYDIDQIKKMYNYQEEHGDLYIIEYFDKKWIPVGDVALMQGTSDDLPIMIGERKYWHRGIGKVVLNYLIQEARENGREELSVTIYYYNTRSINLYTKLGFKQVDNRYILKL